MATVYRWRKYNIHGEERYVKGFSMHSRNGVAFLGLVDWAKVFTTTLTDGFYTQQDRGGNGSSQNINMNDIGDDPFRAYVRKGHNDVFSISSNTLLSISSGGEDFWGGSSIVPRFSIDSPGRYKYVISVINDTNEKGDVTSTKSSTDVYEFIRAKGSYISEVTSTSRSTYPDNNYSGSYWYEYVGIDNQAPTISGSDTDLGGQKGAFKKTFSVDDRDSGQVLNVVVKLNATTIRTINNATRSYDYEVEITKDMFDNLELNRTNTIEISVTDDKGATAIRRYTFTKSNTAPTATVTNSNLGEQNSPFSFSFTPNDADGDKITAKIYLNDVQILDLGEVTKGEKKSITLNKLDFSKLINGEHKIRIEVTDVYGSKGYGYITFSKNVTSGWYKYKKETDKEPISINVMTMTDIAQGAKLTVKVCNNAFDKSPAWEILTEEQLGQSYTFKNKSKTDTKWGIGVWIQVDRDKATKNSYIYGFVGSWQ